MGKNRYQELGASATKEGLHTVLNEAGLADESGLFAGVMPDAAGDPNYCSFMHCDGAGTKSIVAYLHFKETGDSSVFAGLAQDSLVMNLDDVYCIGRPESLQLANTIGRNSRLVDDQLIGEIIKGYKSLTDTLVSLGIPIAMTGGETADMGDVVRTVIVDSVLGGRIAKSELINASAIKPGDVIVGLSSTGQSSYETRPNSGISSNGLTLARHAMLTNEYVSEYPEICDPGVDSSLAYQGPFRTTDTDDALGMSVGEALSSPTRTYSPVLAELYKSLAGKISAVIHLTGGAHTKVLRFGTGNLICKDALFPTPRVFSLIQEHGKVAWDEMYKVFNMGQRLEIYLAEEDAETVISTAAKFKIDAQRIGRVEAHPEGPDAKNEVLLKSETGEFSYRL